MASNQPTIPVKKPDGSVVRMTMSEFAAYKKQKNDTKITTSSPFAPPTPPVSSSSSNGLSTTSPVEKNDPTLEEKLAVLKKREKEHFAKKHHIPRVEHTHIKSASAPSLAPPPAPSTNDLSVPIPTPVASPVVPPPLDFAAIEQAEEVFAHDISEKDPKQQKTSRSLPLVKSTPGKLSTTTPVVDIFKDEAKAKIHVWEKDDTKSPLEDTDTHAHVPISKGSASGVDLVFANIDLPLSDSLKERLYPLFLSRIKDIRSSQQVEEKLHHPEEKGGFGFAQTEVDQIMRALALALNNRPKIEKTQNNAIKKAPKKPSRTFSHGPSDDHVSAKHAVPENIGVRQSVGKKPIIHDIIVPKNAPALDDMLSGIKDPLPKQKKPAQIKRTVGPVGEFGSMDLVTFRRLGDTVEAVVERLQERLGLMRKDSYLLYMDAKKAWKTSPLYVQYTNLVVAALNQRVTLAQQIAQQHDEVPLTQEDIDIIVAFNNTL